MGRKRDAEHVQERMTKVLREQLERVPEDVRARILLASNLAFHEEDADESIRHLQTAVALRPGDANTLYIEMSGKRVNQDLGLQVCYVLP